MAQAPSWYEVQEKLALELCESAIVSANLGQVIDLLESADWDEAAARFDALFPNGDPDCEDK